MTKIAIVGSRNFSDLKEVDKYLTLYKFINKDFKIITGGAIGVDKQAEKWAFDNKIKCKIIRPINSKNKINYLFRNIEIITMSDIVCVFWDGKSKGTKFVIDYCNSRYKELIVYTLK